MKASASSLRELRAGLPVMLVLIWVSGVLPTGTARAQSLPAHLVRGPYLQCGTPHSVIVRWRTDQPTDSRVNYGSGPGDLDFGVFDSTFTTEHEVQLTGLSPDTTYYYSVGTDGYSLAEGPDYFFNTAPVEAKPTRIWVIGDSGTGGSAARAVRDAYYSYSFGRYTDLWLMLGDNAYGSGTDGEYQFAVFDMYPELLRQTVVWPTLGNHDTYSRDVAGEFPYLGIFSLPVNGEAGGVASGSERYYSFNYGDIHFVVLDAMSSDRSPNGPMLRWLQQDLAAATNDWIIAYWHHPPYSRGSHNSDFEFELIEMRRNAVPILESFGVDLVLCGHSHSYERSFLLDGHYGFSGSLTAAMIRDGGDGREDGDGEYHKPAGGLGARQGAVYAVAGCSGQTSGGSLDHPAMFISLNQLGSMVLDIVGDRLDARFLNSNGEVGDYFSIVKGGLPDGPGPALTIGQTANGVVLSWPTSNPVYVLETAFALTPPVRWWPMTNAPTQVGRRNVVSLEVSPTNQFFRLHLD